MQFRSEKQRRAVMRKLSGGGGDVMAGRQLGSSWVRRAGPGKLVRASLGTQDRYALGVAAAGMPEARRALAVFEQKQKREGEVRRQAQHFLLKSLAAGVGVAGAGAALYVGVNPRAQLALGSYLARTRRVLPVRVAGRGVEAVGDAYRQARTAGINRVAEKAAAGVRWFERKVAGYTPGVSGPMGPPGGPRSFRKPKHPMSVQEILPAGLRDRRAHRVMVPNQLTQEWMRKEAADVEHDIRALRTGQVFRQRAGTAADRARHRAELLRAPSALDTDLEYQPGWVDKLDVAWKRRLASGFPHPGDTLSRLLGRRTEAPRRLARLDLDPEWTMKFGAGSPKQRRDAAIEAAKVAQRNAYAKVGAPGDARRAGETGVPSLRTVAPRRVKKGHGRGALAFDTVPVAGSGKVRRVKPTGTTHIPADLGEDVRRARARALNQRTGPVNAAEEEARWRKRRQELEDTLARLRGR